MVLWNFDLLLENYGTNGKKIWYYGKNYGTMEKLWYYTNNYGTSIYDGKKHGR